MYYYRGFSTVSSILPTYVSYYPHVGTLQRGFGKTTLYLLYVVVDTIKVPLKILFNSFDGLNKRNQNEIAWPAEISILVVP